MKNISLNEALKELGWKKAKSLNPFRQYSFRVFDQHGREVGDFTAGELTKYFDRLGMFQEETELTK